MKADRGDKEMQGRQHFFLFVYLPTPPVRQIKEKSEKISQ